MQRKTKENTDLQDITGVDTIQTEIRIRKKKRTYKHKKGESYEEISKNHRHNKRFPYKCYNCGKKGHMVRNCHFEKVEEVNDATSEQKEVRDAEAMYAQV